MLNGFFIMVLTKLILTAFLLTSIAISIKKFTPQSPRSALFFASSLSSATNDIKRFSHSSDRWTLPEMSLINSIRLNRSVSIKKDWTANQKLQSILRSPLISLVLKNLLQHRNGASDFSCINNTSNDMCPWKIVWLNWSRKLPPDGLMRPYFCSTKLLAHSLRRFLPKPLQGKGIQSMTT